MLEPKGNRPFGLILLK